jgi:chromosome segregation ATPase
MIDAELEGLREQLRDARNLIVQLQKELERAYDVLRQLRAQGQEARCGDGRA